MVHRLDIIRLLLCVICIYDILINIIIIVVLDMMGSPVVVSSPLIPWPSILSLIVALLT